MYADLLAGALMFIYTLSHSIGELVVGFIQYMVGKPLPVELNDAVGTLAVLTVLLGIAGVARRFAWVIVIVGWVFIIVRIVLLVI
ncbi:MAG TPA: hypothetical protein HA257_04940 [Candidatus Methanoperedenaceae archaeon]|nr:hypothetical protein [Candidatus Methanoperedenaceae archaeon]